MRAEQYNTPFLATTRKTEERRTATTILIREVAMARNSSIVNHIRDICRSNNDYLSEIWEDWPRCPALPRAPLPYRSNQGPLRRV